MGLAHPAALTLSAQKLINAIRWHALFDAAQRKFPNRGPEIISALPLDLEGETDMTREAILKVMVPLRAMKLRPEKEMLKKILAQEKTGTDEQRIKNENLYLKALALCLQTGVPPQACIAEVKAACLPLPDATEPTPQPFWKISRLMSRANELHGLQLNEMDDVEGGADALVEALASIPPNPHAHPQSIKDLMSDTTKKETSQRLISEGMLDKYYKNDKEIPISIRKLQNMEMWQRFDQYMKENHNGSETGSFYAPNYSELSFTLERAKKNQEFILKGKNGANSLEMLSLEDLDILETEA